MSGRTAQPSPGYGGRNLPGLMGQFPQSVPGGFPAAPAGEVDFRLARNAVLSEFRKGRLGRNDVCDAHPELLRAARNVGQPTTDRCPICGKAQLVHVSYVFGPGLPPSGHTVSGAAELKRLARRARETACYVVEVCPQCAWNHLARAFPVGLPGRPSS
jgi:hypothetical protein